MSGSAISVRQTVAAGVPIHTAASSPIPAGPVRPCPSNISWLTCEPRLSPNRKNLGRRSAGIASRRCTIPFTTIRVWWVARWTLPSDSADGSTEYWMAAEAQSPLVRYSSVSVAT